MQLVFKYQSSSPLQTKNFAKKIAKHLKNGDLIILSGNLGVGKTTFAKGIVAYFNKHKNVKSPSFTLTNIYKTKTLDIYHFDFYRIENINEQLNLFYEAYQKEGIFIIEWGEKIREKIKEDYWYIKIKSTKLEARNEKKSLLSEKQERTINIWAKIKSKWEKEFAKLF